MISSTYLEYILEALLGKTSINSVTPYLALSTADPTIDGSGISEPSGNGYARVYLKTGYGSGNGYHAFGNVSYSSNAVTVSNAYDIQFPKATGSWGTITHFAIYTAQTGGTMIAYGSLTSSISPVADSVAIIEAGNAVLTITES